MSYRAELLENVYDYYDLKYPHGSGDRKVRCPVHDETHPSASLNTDAGVFICFACGAKGSGIDIVMAREGLDYAGAVEFIDKHIAGESGAVRGQLRGKQGRGVHGGSRDRKPSSRYVPSWLRSPS